jgi:hypothetical protein
VKIAASVALGLAACACGAANGPRPVLTVEGPPIAVGTWSGVLTVTPVPRKPPTVAAGKIRARVTSRGKGRYGVRITLPRPGTWPLQAVLGTRHYALRAIRVPGFEGAGVSRVCRDASIPYPPYALTTGFDSLWIACRATGSLERRDMSGRLVARIDLHGLHAWSLAAGAGAVWAVERDRPVLARIDVATNRVTTTQLDEPPIYVWFGDGTPWVAFDGSGTVARIDPATGATVHRFSVGDGPSGFATDGAAVWIASHKSGDIVRIDGDRLTRLGRHFLGATSAPERLAVAGGGLWITGRGLDLERLDALTGAEEASVEIGAAGLDLAVEGNLLHVVSATRAGAARGDPTVAALVTVDAASGNVARRRAATSLSLTGLAATPAGLFADDAVHGALTHVAP